MCKKISKSFFAFFVSGMFFIPSMILSCYKAPEMSLEEIEEYRRLNQNVLIDMTISKPYRGEKFKTGKVGGVWNTTITSDPKSFNLLIAERDGSTSAILSPLTDYLVDYDKLEKKWKPHIASFDIRVNEDAGTLDVHYTLRDDLYWSFLNSDERVKVTSDDVVFWYDEIRCDESMQSSSFSSQFMTLPDGSEKRITIEKIDDLNFVFHFPRIIAEPILSTNMSFGPRFLYKKAKDEGGAEGVKNLHSVDIDPSTLPSMGKYFIAEYVPGQRIVYERNPNYWDKDSNGESIAYPKKQVARIVGDHNTEQLLFMKGEIEDFSPTPEQVDEVVVNAENGKHNGYTVFNSEGGMNASFWSFNQNPKNSDKPFFKWFTKKEFRQAMSCLLNRERIIKQTYRGLASPTYSFFPEANAYYDPSIELKYKFDRDMAIKLLSSCDFSKREDGFLYDSSGVKIEFDLEIIATSSVFSDIAQIISDECKKVGITVNVRQIDFQKMVEQLTATYDWQSLIIALGGGSIFPTQGRNVWLSDGNLHLWYPLQKTPATDWEARVDYLYGEASCIVDHDKAFPFWKEYQEIFLEQCPIIYLMRSRSFFALQNRWDMNNVYFDNLNGVEISHTFLTDNGY